MAGPWSGEGRDGLPGAGRWCWCWCWLAVGCRQPCRCGSRGGGPTSCSSSASRGTGGYRTWAACCGCAEATMPFAKVTIGCLLWCGGCSCCSCSCCSGSSNCCCCRCCCKAGWPTQHSSYNSNCTCCGSGAADRAASAAALARAVAAPFSPESLAAAFVFTFPSPASNASPESWSICSSAAAGTHRLRLNDMSSSSDEEVMELSWQTVGGISCTSHICQPGRWGSRVVIWPKESGVDCRCRCCCWCCYFRRCYHCCRPLHTGPHHTPPWNHNGAAPCHCSCCNHCCPCCCCGCCCCCWNWRRHCFHTHEIQGWPCTCP
mmetsp:Transcript_29530/g.76601  ORF Transcript_29530/g.76601 Transcript_29530/m.76601 type:complete len:318 (+) Transcript_29530:542-1495(+)